MAEPQSRAEAIIRATINWEEYNGLPQSRLEKDLLDLKAAIEAGGGGGGTTDYNVLTNRPTINGNVVEGEISDDILELVEPYNDSDEQDLLDIIADDPNSNDVGHQEDEFNDD